MENNWKEICLGEVCTIRRGSSPRPIVDFITDRGMPWVKIADATESDSKTINKTKQFLKEDGVCKSVIVEKGDLILSNSGTAGLPKFMDITACIHDGWQVFKDLNGITSEFLYYSLIHIRTRLLHGAYDSTMKNLTLDMVRDAKINLPSLAEQKSITNILCSLDDKIELNRQINQNLEQMAQALFKSWFVDFDPVIDNALTAGAIIRDFPEALQLRAEKRKQAQQLPDFKQLPDDIRNIFPNEFEQSNEPHFGISGWMPKGWKKDNLKSFGKVVTGKTPPKKIENAFDSEGIPFITPTDVDSDVYTLNVARYLTEDGINAVKNNVIDKGSVCVTCIGSQMGKTVITPIKAVTNQQLNSITLTDESSCNYIFMNLRMRREELFNLGSSGSTMPILNKSSFENLAVLRPSDDVLKSFRKLTENHLEKILLNSQQNKELADIRDTLLPKLISGEITINKEVA